MKMSDGDSVNDHLNEFNTVTNQLRSVGVIFDDEVRALLILCSLPESWNTLVMVVSNFVSGSNTLKFDDVIGVILSEEMRRKSIGESSGNALSVENRGRQKEKKKVLDTMESLKREYLNLEAGWYAGIVENRTCKERLLVFKIRERSTRREQRGKHSR
ncbi:hypothetical protein KI387_021082 [Taxus chinensis]|uniref:Retrovirus-related Pol polyprotein from transposon TNT 1-94 n=1 Tax=Taxus chinensis TaxID=29808 RepID=A0AA38GCI1_TAXCH|nr:hypothetical protein KI387_021082 [Taxus chinensis]